MATKTTGAEREVIYVEAPNVKVSGLPQPDGD
jgi:hypothetical protein